MEKLLKLLESLQGQLRTIVVNKNLPTTAGQKLYETALSFIGKEASPLDKAPDEYGCAESVNNIVFKAFGDYVGGDLSTYRMYYSIINNKKFAKVSNPILGDIILSPTGFGGTKEITNGHVGILGKDNKIMSNNSKTGLWEENYTLFSWRYRYVTLGKFPVLFFRRVII